MEWSVIEPKANKIKEGLTRIINNLLHEGESENISTPEASLRIASEMLIRPEYNIVVCGEVKRGKSTFINALIGKELLPTGVSETTSQVFRISNSDQESFFLQFKDGSKEPITRDQLKTFGSQTDAGFLCEPIFTGRKLDYIQINTPVTFLPRGINIVDTPGLGALYKSHSEITGEYISRADAVVFIMGAGAPLVQQEKDFLTKVFAITPYVLFVMSKIDTVSKDSWINLIRRNESLLKDSFEKDCYTIPRVFPVSSTLLFQAAMENDGGIKEMFLEDSYFTLAKNELLAIMFRAVGLTRNNFAFTEADKYIKYNLPRIDEQCKNLAENNIHEQEAIKKNLENLEIDFRQKFGVGSDNRQKVVSEVGLILTAAKTQCLQLFDAAGETYQTFHKEIEGLASLEAAQPYSTKMGQNIVSVISSKWEAILNIAQTKITAILRSYKDDLAIQRSANISLSASDTTLKLQDKSTAGAFQGVIKTALPTMGAYYASSMVLGLVGITLSMAFLPLAVLGGAIIGLFSGLHTTDQHELVKAKNELKKGLSDIMNDIRRQMTEISLDQNKLHSVIDSFVVEVSASVKLQLDNYYQKGQEDYTFDKKRLEEQRKLQGESRKKEQEKLLNQRSRWITLQDELQKTAKDLHEINSDLS